MIAAVIFDIGGVLERVGPLTDLIDPWCRRLGLTRAQFTARTTAVLPTPEITTGVLTEDQVRAGYARALGLDDGAAEEFLRDLWDWYCGQPDVELIGYARSLRPAYRTGILSNSADGARREEQARYGFADLVDDVVYSHEVGLAKPDPRSYTLACERLGVAPRQTVFVDDVAENVVAAREAGLHGVLHRDTPATIAAVEALLGRHPGAP